jgi:hypothetical protein
MGQILAILKMAVFCDVAPCKVAYMNEGGKRRERYIQMAAASRSKYLSTLYTNSPKLIGSLGHVTVDAQKRPKLGRRRSCRSL